MRFERIVVGIDFSAPSIAAARYVASQLAPRAEIVLVHVLPEPAAPWFIRPYLAPMLEIVAEIAPALHGALRGLADLIDASRTRIDMLVGAPADALALAAEQHAADLIVLGRRRARRGGARFGATTAHRLLARTNTPLLIVPAGQPKTPERILAAMDDTAVAPSVLRAASDIALASEARLDALHVLAPELRDLARSCRHLEHGREGVVERDRSSDGEWLSLRDEEHLLRLTREWIESQLDTVCRAPSRAHAIVRVGDPGPEIIAFAHQAQLDLIAIGRAGARAEPAPSGPPFQLGSAARFVTWAAPCPVLVMPAGVTTRESPAPERATRRSLRVDSPPGVIPFVATAAAHRLPPAAKRPGPGRGGDAA